MSDKPLSVVVPLVPQRTDADAIYAQLVAYEESVAGAAEIEPLAVLLKDDAGVTRGGLWGTTLFRWLVIELLFVPQTLRNAGLGSSIVQQAEDIARERGCLGVWLETYSFSALGFYEKLGYRRFGHLDDNPPGHQRLFMRKFLTSVAQRRERRRDPGTR